MFKFIKNHKNKLIKITTFVILGVIYFILYKIYIPRVNAFGCFDDCFNFMGGYFLLKGKHIFADFFYNHQPITAYISLVIQYITTPDSIYELVLRHRQFILLLGLISYILLIFRFGSKIILFAIVFEFSKFYLFGDRFLAENIIVYPIIYLIGLVFLKFNKQKLSNIDLLISSLFTWFIVFSREPYIPLAIFLLAVILYSKKLKDIKKTPLILFLTISLVTVFAFNINEYFYNLITINFQVVIPNEIKGQLYGGLETIFLYPVFVFINGPHNIFKFLLIGIDILFMFYFLSLIRNRKFLLAFILFLILGLANLKPNIPGKLFYESFHMVIWYGSFTFITIMLIFSKIKENKIHYLSISLLVFIFILFIYSNSYFVKEKISTHEEFLTQYGTILQDAEVIKVLSKPSDTLFLDGDNELMYWQAKRISPYKYTWYTSVMPSMEKYSDARIEMFKETPPDIYRENGLCPKKNKDINSFLPTFIEKEYINLIADGKQSCIYIKRDLILNISREQWDEAKKWLYELPK
jgi:hypothetical protein